MEGAQGGCAWPVGGRLPVIVAGWLNGAVWPRQAHFAWECKNSTRDHNCKTMAFFFLARECPPPDMSFNAALSIRQRAEFNLGKGMVILRLDYIDWLDVIYILEMGKPAGNIFC